MKLKLVHSLALGLFVLVNAGCPPKNVSVQAIGKALPFNTADVKGEGLTTNHFLYADKHFTATFYKRTDGFIRFIIPQPMETPLTITVRVDSSNTDTLKLEGPGPEAPVPNIISVSKEAVQAHTPQLYKVKAIVKNVLPFSGDLTQLQETIDEIGYTHEGPFNIVAIDHNGKEVKATASGFETQDLNKFVLGDEIGLWILFSTYSTLPNSDHVLLKNVDYKLRIQNDPPYGGRVSNVSTGEFRIKG